MKTPIADFVKTYAESGISRFHMPGHKGVGPLGCERLDITEIDGAGVLYGVPGIIEESEKNASVLFGAAHTFYSVEGSSPAVKAMLALAVGAGGRVLAARNVHKSFLYGCALLDITPDWLYPESGEHMCSCKVSPDALRERLSSGDLPAAVYVTSPDYLGNMQDIAGLSAVCREFSVPLIVDGAHGAYLKFMEHSLHPIDLGAAMCCDSAHKTLPVLTGGAYLHISEHARQYIPAARKMLSVFASTSPSYLILQSLDLCNRYLAEGGIAPFQKTALRVSELKRKIEAAGWKTCGDEPLKITVDCAGYTGTQIAEMLRDYGVEAEFADRDYVVLMASPQNREEDFRRVGAAFQEINPKSSRRAERPSFGVLRAEMTVREAVFAPHETVPAEQAVGRICGAPAVGCPPEVPIAVSGEVITAETAEILKYYRFCTVEVVK